ncbi:TolC family protein [bacterium]|nr:TolC family protein [bacterium]
MKILVLLISLIFFCAPVSAEVVRFSLDEAVQLTLRNNLDLQAKRKELGIANANIKIANKLQNPQVQSNILVGRVRTGNSSQVGLMFPFETMKRGVRKKAAIARKKSVENQIRQFEHELKIKVMKAYFDVLYYKSVVTILNERKALYENMLSITKNRSESLSTYKIDILQSDIRYKKLLVELNRAKADLISAQFMLNKVINLPSTENMYDTQETSLFNEDLTILDIELPAYNIIEAIAMKYSHSIRIADNKIEELGYDYVLSKRQRVPDFSVGGGFAWQARYHGEGNWWPGAFVGGSLDVPMLYTYRPDINKAKLTLEKARMDKNSFENKLKITLKQNYNNFKYSKENMGYYKEILKQSNEILQMVTQRYQNGETALINLIMTENNHQEVLSEYLVAMDLYYSVYLEMMQNVGHDILLEEEIFEEE